MTGTLAGPWLIRWFGVRLVHVRAHVTGVGVILAAIDLATFVGWVQARWKGIPDLTTEHTEQHGKNQHVENIHSI